MRKKVSVTTVFALIFVLIIAFGVISYNISINKRFSDLVSKGEQLLASKDYEQALQTMSEALNIKEDTSIQKQAEDIKKIIKDQKEIEASNEAFNAAHVKIDEKNYSDALTLLSNVKQIDKTNYDIAQQKIPEVKKLYAKALLEEAKELYSKKFYAGAFLSVSKAKENDPELSGVAELYTKYEKKKIEQEKIDQEKAAKALKESKIAIMKQYESGMGPVRIAAEVKITKTFDTGYTTYYSTDGKGWFVRIFVNVANNGSDTIHVNPNYFTLSTPDGYTVNPHEAMYSLSNYFDATDLRANSYTSGWLIFYISKEDHYFLNYESMESDVRKEIVF